MVLGIMHLLFHYTSGNNRMEKVRFIGMFSSDGSLEKETIVFTRDFNSPVTDWLVSGMMVHTDKVIKMDVPHCFPMEKEFKA